MMLGGHAASSSVAGSSLASVVFVEDAKDDGDDAGNESAIQSTALCSGNGESVVWFNAVQAGLLGSCEIGWRVF